jgi:hypothetical protein
MRMMMRRASSAWPWSEKDVVHFARRSNRSDGDEAAAGEAAGAGGLDWYGQADITRHVVDAYCAPSLHD